ncbi:unnamed protein product, partial [Rotaria sp. Silwood2]
IFEIIVNVTLCALNCNKLRLVVGSVRFSNKISILPLVLESVTSAIISPNLI